ncbi:hypothetical protein H5410_027789 [Solanum commersonii]|uniref:Uncharacterized protein n=1 Tax=Solanum commersonii TaxID=4109 RepID=A0A9J5Z058_SOLCO|nr:hypothetical protein H5410_027789 [Solanum commersonii]
MQAKTKTYNYLQVTGLADTHDEPQAEEENEVLQQESYEEAEIHTELNKKIEAFDAQLPIVVDIDQLVKQKEES